MTQVEHRSDYELTEDPQTLLTSLIARFMGPTWGPSGADRTQVGPMLAPWTLLSGMFFNCKYFGEWLIACLAHIQQISSRHEKQMWCCNLSSCYILWDIFMKRATNQNKKHLESADLHQAILHPHMAFENSWFQMVFQNTPQFNELILILVTTYTDNFIIICWYQKNPPKNIISIQWWSQYAIVLVITV